MEIFPVAKHKKRPFSVERACGTQPARTPEEWGEGAGGFTHCH
jgi:hypothetical protein